MFDGKEYELMLENQKLKMENKDLQSYKGRQKSSLSEMESRLKRYQEDLVTSREDNIKLKAHVSQLEQQKEFELEDLKKEIKIMKEKYEDVQKENLKFRAYLKDRTQSHMAESEYAMNSEARDEIQKKRVQKLLDYRPKDSEGNDIFENFSNIDYKDTNTESNYNSVIDPPNENQIPLDTPNRLQHPSTGDEVFLESSKRKFVKNYTIPEKSEGNNISNENEKEKDREVYGGFNESESEATSMYVEENNDNDQKLLQSIERRVGGKF